MKPISRLLDSHHDEFELALLRAGSTEEPHPDATRRVAAALGVGFGALTAAGSAEAVRNSAEIAAGAGATAGAGVSVGVSVKAGLFLLKALGVGVLVGAGVFGVVAQRSRSASSGAGTPVPTVGAPRSPALVPGNPARTAPSAFAPRSPSLPRAEPEQTAETSAPPARGAHAAPASSLLAVEVAALDRARSELRAGRPQQALVELDGHRRRFPRGGLRLEAEVLRVQALAESGERDGAARLAKKLLSNELPARYAERLRAYTVEEP